MKKILSTLISITIFSIAMAFLETAVVIYLRELLYPGGFSFPLTPMPGNLVLTELLREFATILMLIGVGALAGKTFSQRFAWFIYSFAIWDIFYYVFLKIMINWPESILTWDLLFLIPTSWTGPVISPLIVSLTLIVFAIIILFFNAKGYDTRIVSIEWVLLVCGSIILFVSFTLDYSSFILENFDFKEIWTIQNREMIYATALKYIPRNFSWLIFISGEIVVSFSIFLYYRRIIKKHLYIK